MKFIKFDEEMAITITDEVINLGDLGVYNAGFTVNSHIVGEEGWYIIISIEQEKATVEVYHNHKEVVFANAHTDVQEFIKKIVVPDIEGTWPEMEIVTK